MSELNKSIIEFIKSTGMPVTMKILAIEFERDYDPEEISEELRKLTRDCALNREQYDGSYLYSLVKKAPPKPGTLSKQIKTEEKMQEPSTLNIENNITAKFAKLNNPLKIDNSVWKKKIVLKIAEEFDDEQLKSDSVSLALKAIANDYDSFVAFEQALT